MWNTGQAAHFQQLSEKSTQIGRFDKQGEDFPSYFWALCYYEVKRVWVLLQVYVHWYNINLPDISEGI